VLNTHKGFRLCLSLLSYYGIRSRTRGLWAPHAAPTLSPLPLSAKPPLWRQPRVSKSPSHPLSGSITFILFGVHSFVHKFFRIFLSFSSMASSAVTMFDPFIYNNYVIVHLSIDKLDGTSYDTWSPDVKVSMSSIC